MRQSNRRSRNLSQGFSLLEMLVAVSILALALAVIYQAASGATRNVRTDERYAYAVELARSLLAVHSKVPASGVDAQGETAGQFSWRVNSNPVDLPGNRLPAGSLHEIQAAVSWRDGRKKRELVLHSVVEGVRQ